MTSSPERESLDVREVMIDALQRLAVERGWVRKEFLQVQRKNTEHMADAVLAAFKEQGWAVCEPRVVGVAPPAEAMTAYRATLWVPLPDSGRDS